MRPILHLTALLGPALAAARPVPAADGFPPHPDAQVQPGVPRGELLRFEFAGSKIFPGTTREVTVYVPKQYDPATPACVYVNQDGVQWNAPVVFDNLIARGELPILVGVFVRPGVVKSAAGAAALDRYNRSFEYDGLGDRYARFLMEELLPAVETKSTSDGRPIRLSASGNDRAIGGSSSGAICAFTVAWERPDAFRRVFSNVGTFVALRGGDRYASLVRKYEPKPLRVFLVDGANDNNIYGGDWWMANQTLGRALAFSGYDVRHVWGEGGHNARHATTIWPDAIRWLWRGWPEPVRPAGPTRNDCLAALLIHEPAVRRREVRHALRHLRRQGVPAKAQDHRRARLGCAEQAARPATLSFAATRRFRTPGEPEGRVGGAPAAVVKDRARPRQMCSPASPPPAASAR